MNKEVIQQVFADGLQNLAMGMGGAGSKRAANEFFFDKINDKQLEDMYRSDWMCQKAVDIIANDMTKDWRSWELSTPERNEQIITTERLLNIPGKVNKALKQARVFGGSGLLISDGTTQHSKPLGNIKKGGIKYILPIPRTKLTGHGQIDWDPNSDHFGLPEFFTFNNTQSLMVHHSRIIIFRGVEYIDPINQPDCFGDSIFDAISSAIEDSQIANQSASAIIAEAKVDVVTMENLEAHLADDDGTARVRKRIELMRQMKSINRILLLGGSEKYDVKAASLANIDNVLLALMQIVSGAVDIPMTRFLAQSPAGMNSTGQSDLKNYASMILSKQTQQLQPAITRLDEMILRHTFGTVPRGALYNWNSIYTSTPKEAAEINKINSDADKNYAESGLVTLGALEKSIQSRLAQSPIYPGLDVALSEIGDEPPPAPPVDDGEGE